MQEASPLGLTRAILPSTEPKRSLALPQVHTAKQPTVPHKNSYLFRPGLLLLVTVGCEEQGRRRRERGRGEGKEFAMVCTTGKMGSTNPSAPPGNLLKFLVAYPQVLSLGTRLACPPRPFLSSLCYPLFQFYTFQHLTTAASVGDRRAPQHPNSQRLQFYSPPAEGSPAASLPVAPTIPTPSPVTTP